MPVDQMAVATYNTHIGAGDAVKALRSAGFAAGNLSIAGKDHYMGDQILAFSNFGGRMRHNGKYREFWASIWEELSGAAFIDLPAIGPVLMAGPLAAWVFRALEGAAMWDGLSAVGAGLFNVGMSAGAISGYEAALRGNQLLLLAEGKPAEVRMAHTALERTSPAGLTVHASYNSGPELDTITATAA